MKLVWITVLFCVRVSSWTFLGSQRNIYNEASWPLKLLLLKESKVANSTVQTSQQHIMKEAQRRVGIQAYKMKSAKNEGAEVETTSHSAKHDENNMKMRLYRLMYETIRDSEVKIKRAEVVMKFYGNSSSFDLGYVMGEISQRFSVMTDIAVTLKRFYEDWGPMEHINAYEQIANKAVELSHLTDVAWNLANKNNLTMRSNKGHSGRIARLK